MNSRTWTGRFIAAFVLSAFAWALALSVAPQLHERIHADANRAEHSCAVTLIAAGNCEHTSHAPLGSEPMLPVLFDTMAVLSPSWVPSPFLSASVLEHAPPALA